MLLTPPLFPLARCEQQRFWTCPQKYGRDSWKTRVSFSPVKFVDTRQQPHNSFQCDGFEWMLTLKLHSNKQWASPTQTASRCCCGLKPGSHSTTIFFCRLKLKWSKSHNSHLCLFGSNDTVGPSVQYMSAWGCFCKGDGHNITTPAYKHSAKLFIPFHNCQTNVPTEVLVLVIVCLVLVGHQMFNFVIQNTSCH